jgi:hypothetical protein
MSMFDDLKLQLFRVTARREVRRLSREDEAAKAAGQSVSLPSGTGEFANDSSLVWARNESEAWALFNDSRKMQRGRTPHDRVEAVGVDDAGTLPDDYDAAPFVADEAEELETAAA